MNRKTEKKILSKLIAITGKGCWNCGAEQLIEYYEVKDGRFTHNICSKCCKPKKAGILN